MTWVFRGIYEFEMQADEHPELGSWWPTVLGVALLANPERQDPPLRFVVYTDAGSWPPPAALQSVQLQLQGQDKWVGGAEPGEFLREQPDTLECTAQSPNQNPPFVMVFVWHGLLSDMHILCLFYEYSDRKGLVSWATQDDLNKKYPAAATVLVNVILHCLVPPIAQIITAGGAPGTDFSTATLDGEDFGGRADQPLLDLRKCVFDHCSLRNARLSFVNLSHASLANADLSGADLSGSTLTGADLRGATLVGTNFSNVDLTQSLFQGRPRFSSDPHNPTKFIGATLPFSLIGQDWSYLDLTAADIVGIPIDHAGRLALPGLKAVAANLTGLDLSNLIFRDADFSAATLVGANLSGTDCTGANFRGATLGGGPGQAAAVMSAATLFNAIFDDAQLSGVNFSGAYLHGAGASVSGATLAGVDFSNAYLTGLDLSNVRNANMAGAIFDGACCVNCNFRGTTVMPDSTGRGGSFESACLQGADFSDATLGGADLVGAGCAPPCPSPGTCKFPVTLTIEGSPVEIQITVIDAGTVLPASATTHATVCPNKSNGPCTGVQLYASDAPTSWPVARTT